MLALKLSSGPALRVLRQVVDAPCVFRGSICSGPALRVLRQVQICSTGAKLSVCERQTHPGCTQRRVFPGERCCAGLTESFSCSEGHLVENLTRFSTGCGGGSIAAPVHFVVITKQGVAWPDVAPRQQAPGSSGVGPYRWPAQRRFRTGVERGSVKQAGGPLREQHADVCPACLGGFGRAADLHPR